MKAKQKIQGMYYKTLGIDLQQILMRTLDKLACFLKHKLEQASLLRRKFRNYGSVRLYNTSPLLSKVLVNHALQQVIIQMHLKVQPIFSQCMHSSGKPGH